MNNIKEKIKTCLNFIENSCFLFDKGDRKEALRVSTQLYNLLNPGEKHKGILWLYNPQIKLLSALPPKIDENRLIIRKVNNFSEVDGEIARNKREVKSKKRFLLIYIKGEEGPFLYGFDFQGNEIQCPLRDLHLNLNKRVRGPVSLYRWIKSEDQIKLDKQDIISHLDRLLGYQTFHRNSTESLSLMQNFSFNLDYPFKYKPMPCEKRVLSMKEWLEEIVFFDLKREDFIKEARHNQAAHILTDDSKKKRGKIFKQYQESEVGETFAISSTGEEMTTAGLNFWILRHLGYEILHSLSLVEDMA